MVRLGLAASFGLLLAGCATTGNQKGAKTANSLTRLRTDAWNGRQQINLTLQSLDRLLQPGTANLAPLLDAYNREVRKLNSIASTVQGHAEAMRRNRESYFTAWLQELEIVQNPNYRMQGEARRKALYAQFGHIEAALASVGAAYQPLMNDLTDVQTVLRNDLTAHGLQTVEGAAAKAHRDAQIVNERIRTALVQIDQVIKELPGR